MKLLGLQLSGLRNQLENEDNNEFFHVRIEFYSVFAIKVTKVAAD